MIQAAILKDKVNITSAGLFLSCCCLDFKNCMIVKIYIHKSKHHHKIFIIHKQQSN